MCRGISEDFGADCLGQLPLGVFSTSKGNVGLSHQGNDQLQIQMEENADQQSC